MDAGYGKTRSTLTQGVYNVIFRYLDEEAGILAGKAALNLINSILLGKSFDVFEIIGQLVLIREKNDFICILTSDHQLVYQYMDGKRKSWNEMFSP
nr:hypothetical protein [Bacteroidota bacterium]